MTGNDHDLPGLRTYASACPPVTPTAQASRLVEIDSLRGLAAIWVVVFHFSFGVRYFWFKDDPTPAALVTPFSVNIQGLLGVDLFFLISGFVIFMTLERSATVSAFVVSRFSRLFPTYWACLALTTAAIFLLPVTVQSVTLPQIAASATMLNAFMGFEPVETVYWSLSFEIAFYTLMICVFAAKALERIEILGGIWLALSTLSYALFPSIGAMIPWRIQLIAILPYVPLFFAGVLLYRIRSRGWTVSRAALLLACFLSRLASFRYPPMIVGTIAIFAIFAAASLGWAPVLRWRPLLFLGGISYPLYLVHYTIGFRIQSAMVMQLGASAFAGFAIALCGVTALAWAISVLIERPAQTYLRAAYRRMT